MKGFGPISVAIPKNREVRGPERRASVRCRGRDVKLIGDSVANDAAIGNGIHGHAAGETESAITTSCNRQTGEMEHRFFELQLNGCCNISIVLGRIFSSARKRGPEHFDDSRAISRMTTEGEIKISKVNVIPSIGWPEDTSDAIKVSGSAVRR